MIATGLVFVLGALVAALLSLLFVPFLWRNAQRLARRDFAATMPASMNEIRAEVDRVRAEAAMSVRRHEMLAQKARESAARERAEVGRLTAAKAELTFLGDQHSGEVNALRGELALAQQRVAALEEARARLDEENATLRQGIAPGDPGMTTAAAPAAAVAPVVSAPTVLDPPTPTVPAPLPVAAEPAPTPPADEPRPIARSSMSEAAEGARVRVAAAAAALVALTGERRQSPVATPVAAPVDAPVAAPAATLEPNEEAPSIASQAYPIPGLPRVGPRDVPSPAPEPAIEVPSSVPEAAASPSDGADIRERIADIAARVIQMTSLKEGPGSPIAGLLSPGQSPEEPDGGPPTLAQRVRRLSQPRAAKEPVQNGADHPAPEIVPEAEIRPEPETPPAEIVAAAETESAAAVSPAAKRRRGGARSRQRSPR